MNMQTSDSIVIIPTYNERENIENIIRAVFALEHGFHILVIEDGSPDGTAAIVKDLQREFPNRLFMVEVPLISYTDLDHYYAELFIPLAE